MNFEPIQMDAVGIAHLMNFKCSYEEPVKDKWDWTGENETELNLDGKLRIKKIDEEEIKLPFKP